MKNEQLANTVLMIRPSSFRYNSETASDNKYQNQDTELSAQDISKKAQYEFDTFLTLLQSHGIKVIDFTDNDKAPNPDSIFPNNWISTHRDGTIFIYPMFALNRRLERRVDIIDFLKNHFVVKKVINNSENHELSNVFLEGTGSVVLDRVHRIAYACLSQRTDKALFHIWCKTMNFEPVSFIARDGVQDIYHTNVLMSVCDSMVFICLDAIVCNSDKEMLLEFFERTNKEVIQISLKQMNNFLGNVIELQNSKNESFLVMSTSAFNSLSSSQRTVVNKKSTIIHSSLSTIEYFGGGSARCMLAEIFLPPQLI